MTYAYKLQHCGALLKHRVYVYIYVYMCLYACFCVCVCDKKRDIYFHCSVVFP